MNGFNLEDLMPMPPNMGPPLPRFLGIFWPWYEPEIPPEEGYVCPFCGAVFDTQKELNQHIRKEHRIPIPITWGGLAALGTPEFEPGVSKTATATMSNPTAKSWTYSAELYLGEAKVATSGSKSFTIPAGGSKDVNFPVTMPSAEGTYPVFIDVFVAGTLIAAYQGTEDVVIAIKPAIEVGEIIWAGR